MIAIRRFLGSTFLLAGLVSVLVLCVPSRVSATTGVTKFLADSKYKVKNKVELLYTGTYTMGTVSSAARLRGGALAIEISNRGFLVGLGQFYGYDDQGFQSTWTGTLYNFRLA